VRHTYRWRSRLCSALPKNCSIRSATLCVSSTTLWLGHRTNRSLSTEKTYVAWIKRFILYHNKRHPLDMGSTEVEAYLTHLAVKQQVAASTQNQALSPWA